jgi:Tfp pilus assembly protein PilE
MTRLVHEERGLTLTELLAAMLLAVILFGAAVTTFVEFLDTSTRADQGTQSIETSRNTIERLAAQLRNAQSTGTTGAQPVQSYSDFDLVFLAPSQSAISTTNNPRGLVFHRYCLGNANNKSETLWYQTATFNSSTQSSAPPLDKCPSNNWPTKNMAARYLINRSNPVTPLFVPTVDGTGSVTAMTINARVDVNPDVRPLPTDLRSKIVLRNTNRVPTASVTCKGLANGHAVCDASASNDPDGQSLTYSWKMGTTQLSDTKYLLDYSPLPSGATRTFTVTVTDSGGATASDSESVTIP